MISLLLRRPIRSSFTTLRPYAARAASKKPQSKSTSEESTPAPPSDAIIAPGSENHHDLPSFLSYAERVGLASNKTVYVGTHYEYTVAASLARLGFNLTRTGRSSDYGIDLLGTWTLRIPPPSPASSPHDQAQSQQQQSQQQQSKQQQQQQQQQHSRHQHPLRVLVQCKVTNVAPSPKHIRELEGAFTGAPAAWRSDDFLGLLATTKSATRGVIDALARSRWPMGFLKIDADGRVEQFLWNPSARQRGLEGLGVALRYLPAPDGEVRTDVALTWEGMRVPYVEVEEAGALSGLKGELEGGAGGEAQDTEDTAPLETVVPEESVEEKPVKRKRGRPRKKKEDEPA